MVPSADPARSRRDAERPAPGPSSNEARSRMRRFGVPVDGLTEACLNATLDSIANETTVPIGLEDQGTEDQGNQRSASNGGRSGSGPFGRKGREG